MTQNSENRTPDQTTQEIIARVLELETLLNQEQIKARASAKHAADLEAALQRFLDLLPSIGGMGNRFPICAFNTAGEIARAVMGKPAAENERVTLRIGDRVRVRSGGEMPYFRTGNEVILTHMDSDGDWWGNVVGGMSGVCLTQFGTIEPA